MGLALTRPLLLYLFLQDEQKCVETVELGSYEKCQDLRTVLKRKHRFILLRSPGNKVGAILNAASLEAGICGEKASWAWMEDGCEGGLYLLRPSGP